jgi:hypothetical protein
MNGKDPRLPGTNSASCKARLRRLPPQDVQWGYYVLCGNNPANYFDANGLHADDDTGTGKKLLIFTLVCGGTLIGHIPAWGAGPEAGIPALIGACSVCVGTWMWLDIDLPEPPPIDECRRICKEIYSNPSDVYDCIRRSCTGYKDPRQ